MSYASAGERLVLRDGGQLREFEIALDERHRLSPVAPLRQPNAAALTLPVLYEANRPRTAFTRRIVTGRVLVRLGAGADCAVVAASVAANAHDAFAFAPGWHALRAASPDAAFALATDLRRHPDVITARLELARQRVRRRIPDDSMFSSQWNLLNTGQGGGLPGADINVTGAWNHFTGAGVHIAIVDDGVETTHPDLQSGILTSLGYDFLSDDSDPSPEITDDDHGTAVAGIAGARADNAIGLAGVAFGSTLVGVRLLGDAQTDAMEAAALRHAGDVIAVYNNSWGPPDTGEDLIAPEPLLAAALLDGVTHGRQGRGSIYVWAAGNGWEFFDNSNFDGYANSIYTIAVAATHDRGEYADYSEPGANLVVSAPGGGDSSRSARIRTTDRSGDAGINSSASAADLTDRDYTAQFSGTSAATPHVAGTVALMLEANPLLGWRDVQEILMRSARVTDPTEGLWTTNTAGFHFSHSYGAGLLDASNAVMQAYHWTNLGPHTNTTFTFDSLSVPVPDNDQNGTNYTFQIPALPFRVEHITVAPQITHTFRGDLEIGVESPTGTYSHLANANYDAHENITGWKYMSVRHWGEDPAGTWTLYLTDLGPEDLGTLTGLAITFHGALPEANPTVSTNRPLFLQAPVGADLAGGESLILSVETLSDMDTFQWLKDDLPIAGATNSTLRLGNLARDDTGMFSVTAENANGYALSPIANLRVRVPQRLELLHGAPPRLRFRDQDGSAMRPSSMSGFVPQYRADISFGNWSDVPQPLTFIDGWFEFTDDGAGDTQRFYRVIER